MRIAYSVFRQIDRPTRQSFFTEYKMTLSEQPQQIAVRIQQIERNELVAGRSLVAGYQETLKSLSARYDALPPEPLTIPTIFGRGYDENFISYYLAYILDPKRNGIGIGPIKALCGIYGRDVADLPWEDVIIYREYVLGGRRIDLLLEIEDQWVLGIENKIFASEATNQTSDYARLIAAKFPKSMRDFIFLTKGGEQAQSKCFSPISYACLLKALKTVSLDASLAGRKRVLWEDFLEHLEVYIVMTNSPQFQFSEKTQLYLKNYQMLQDMERTFKDDWREAIEHLERYLSTLITNEPWEADGEWEIDASKTGHHWLLFRNKAWNEKGLNIDFWWQLSPGDWKEGRIPFTIDWRGKKELTTTFLEQIDEEYRKDQNQHNLSGMIYRPSYRPVCIVQKNYSFDGSIAAVETIFVQSIADFQFLIPIIDRVAAKIVS